jgi:transposase
VLFIGDDWAQDHHDIEIEGDDGRRLVRARLPEGLGGITRLHALVAEHAPAEWAQKAPEEVAGQVVVGIETDRGPWVTALRAAGYQVFPINPLSAARYRDRHSTSGAKSDRGDAHVLAEIVRLDRDHHRPVAGDSDLADSVKLLARAHQSAVWERTRHVLRLRSALLEFFPAAVEAFEDLAAADTLRLLRRAPDPVRAAKLTRSQLVAALRASRRHHAEARAAALLAVLRAPVLRQSPTLEGAYATIVVGQVGIISALNGQISQLQKVMTEHFGRHPAADIYLSQPGFGVVCPCKFWRHACSVSSATTRTGLATPGHAKTILDRAQSPEPRARRPSCSPATPRTVVSASRYTCKLSPRSARLPVHGHITTRCGSGRSVTTPLYAS